MLVYSPITSSRLTYILQFIATELGCAGFTITTNQELFIEADEPKINYSAKALTPTALWIMPHGLLFENGVQPVEINCFEWNGNKAFFKTGGDFPFDIFAASFYLLTRYEEYLPHQKDIYGRYWHTNSLAYKEGFLNQPLIQLWLRNFAVELSAKGATFSTKRFSFQPTYDIDEAFSYKYKGGIRTTGAMAKAAFHGNFNRIAERLRVLANKKEDPFYSFPWMDALHEKYGLQPVYFFLVAAQNGRYDRNILPHHKAIQKIIRQHAQRYKVGLHPSWQSGDKPSLLENEIQTLSTITQQKVTASRQHFIRFTLPLSYRMLEAVGIRNEYSMGYGTINGFRASVTSPFYWYDLEEEKQTNLLVHPFCFMDANSFFEEQKTATEAFEELLNYYAQVKLVNGTLCTLWHNTFLGTDKLFAGWREAYQAFLQQIKTGEQINAASS